MDELLYPEVKASIASSLSNKMKILLDVNGKSAEVDLNLEEDLAKIQNYPKDWGVYDRTFFAEELDEEFTYEEVIEQAEQFVEGLEIYISRSTEKEILKQILMSLKARLEQEPCPIVGDLKEQMLLKITRLF